MDDAIDSGREKFCNGAAGSGVSTDVERSLGALSAAVDSKRGAEESLAVRSDRSMAVGDLTSWWLDSRECGFDWGGETVEAITDATPS